MGKIMKDKLLHFNPMIPGSIGAYQWDSLGRTIKDVVLNYAEADRLRIAEMTLNATSISAIAEDNTEHTILKFKDQYQLKLHDISTGKSVKTNSIMKLKPGKYTKLRFYIKGNVDYKSENREEKGIYGLEYLEFEFEKVLEVKGNESPEFVLRFNFVSLKPKSLLTYFNQLKPIHWPKSKWMAKA